MVKRNGSWQDFPGLLIAVVVLGCMAVIFLVAWPAELLHGNARWIGESLWLGIPAFCTAAIFSAQRWRTRDKRKLARLREERLLAEGRHPAQLAARQWRIEQEQRMLRYEQAQREAAEARKAAIAARERRKQQIREEIKREERLRNERLGKARPLDPSS